MDPVDSSPVPRKRIWQAVLILLLVFVLGAGTGAGLFGLKMRSQFRRVALSEQGSDEPIDRLTGAIKERLTRSLDLSESEQESVNQEIQTAASGVKRIRGEAISGIRDEIRSTARRIEQALPPEKRDLFRKQTSERLRNWGIEPRENPPVP